MLPTADLGLTETASLRLSATGTEGADERLTAALLSPSGQDALALSWLAGPVDNSLVGSAFTASALPGPLIAEFQSNPPGTDPATQTIELSGEAGTSFTGVLLSIESDAGSSAGTVDRLETVSGTFDANGLLTVEIADLENPSFTLVLLDSFTGAVGTDIDTDDDGTADDLSTFGTVLDAIGVPDTAGDEAFVYGAELGGTDFAYTGAEPELIFRDGSVGDLYAVNFLGSSTDIVAADGTVLSPSDFDTDPTLAPTFGALNPTLGSQAAPVLIAEFQSNPPGTDPATQTIELSGEAGTSFTGVLLSIESDAGSSAGTVDRLETVSGTFDANGLLTVEIADLENPSFTLVLLDSFTGAVGTDIDTDDDGTADDLSTFGTVLDAIGVPDTAGDEAFVYGAELGGTDFAYTGAEPELIFRDGSVGDLYAVNFLGSSTDIVAADGTVLSPSDFDTDPTLAPTFGALNPTLMADPEPITLISDVQGTGAVSPLAGGTVTVRAVVVGDFQDGGLGENGDFNGFYLQEEDADADGDAQSSEGIFVFDGSSPAIDVAVGDLVEVTGTVTEFFGETQISLSSIEIISADNTLPTAATITFPVADVVSTDDGTLIADLEAYEGMLVTVPNSQQLTVTDLFTYGRFGDIGLTAGDRLPIFTQDNAPDAVGYAAFLEEAAKSTLVIDDGSSVQNPTSLPYPDGFFDGDEGLRAGDSVQDLVGVVRYSRGSGGFGDENFRINPVEAPTFVNDNPRPTEAPDVGGDLTVATFNVLNFFTTLDQNGNTSGPSNLEPRGADNQAEFDRQLDKLVQAIGQSGADILSLVELENEFADTNGDGQFAIGTLVDALNTAFPTETYAYVDPGQSFVDVSDAISVGFIYKTDKVQLAEGTTVEILSDADLPGLGLSFGQPVFDGVSTNRAALAATFEEIDGGGQVTLVANHFKSKGGSGSGGDADQGDGAGAFNQTRLNAAIALDAWLATDPTSSGDADVMILGDLNAYAMEDPIAYLKNAGFTDLVDSLADTDYTYGFPVDLGIVPQAQGYGTLDYAFANASLLSQVVDAAVWHINADEPPVIDYDLDFKPTEQEAYFDPSTPFRSSDHDPVLIGLNLTSSNVAPTAFDDDALVTAGQSVEVDLLVNDVDEDNDPLTVVDLDVAGLEGSVLDNGDGTVTYSTEGRFAYLAEGETALTSFGYTISDGEEQSSATVLVTVEGPVEVANSGTAFSLLTFTNGGLNLFTFDGDAFRAYGQGADAGVSYDEVEAFLAEAAALYGGVVSIEATIDDAVLADGEAALSIEATAEGLVTLAGDAIDGTLTFAFATQRAAENFEAFLFDLTDEIAANGAVANDPTDFRFDLGGLRVFYDQIGDQFGFTADGGATQSRFDALDPFVEAIATVFGATALRDGAIDGLAAAEGESLTVLRAGTFALLTGGAIEGTELYRFADEATAVTVATGLNDLFDLIDETAAVAAEDASPAPALIDAADLFA